MRVLMVCLGNICRSPMAEGILTNSAKENGVSIEVDSAGTGNYHVGENPDPRAIATAKKFGVDISDLIARQFKKEDFQQFDHIFVMDKSNYDNVIRLAQSNSDRQKVRLYLSLIPSFPLEEVPDPWFGGPEGFVEVFQMLNKATDAFLEEIKDVK
ncbi:MAG: low molecular weight phosphotyrosine protein phosphatase [Bacteroidetes bacterium]|nr:low molecular weight phosphotyrosine protein phosphatase [Bacteroidota bacterium]